MTNWKYTLDVSGAWYDGDPDEMNDELKKALLDIAVLVDSFREETYGDDDHGLNDLADELTEAAEAEDLGWFNCVWDLIYDWADDNKVWVVTR